MHVCFSEERSHVLCTGAKPTLGPNCMIPYTCINIFIYGTIQFGPKVGVAPVVLCGLVLLC